MEQEIAVKNWQIGQTPDILNSIHQSDVNIVIQNRNIHHLQENISALLNEGFEFRSSGDIQTILAELKNLLGKNSYNAIYQDFESIIRRFGKVTDSDSFRVLLSVVDSDMCRKFHTDINDLRLLCTYAGPGTLWLTEDNIDRNALNALEEDGCIIKDESKIKQAETGSIVLLKGAIYPKENTRAAVHRSPSIEENGNRRLLLRIDTNDFLIY